MQKLEYPSIGETLYRDTLPNGLRLSVAVKPGFTRAHAFFATRYGGADRRFRLGGEFIDTPMGVAHFLEHKMFDMPGGDNALSTLAANGAQPNAFTSAGMTAYYFESTAHFDENLRELLRFVLTPYFTEESVAKEQGIIAQEIRMGEDEPGYVGYVELMRCLYDHHPIRDSVAGTVESIAEITPETLYTCHKIFYTPGNMALAVVGDVDPEAVRAAAMELLPTESGEIPVRDYGAPEALTPCRTRFTRAMEVSAPQALLGAKLRPAEPGEPLLRQKALTGMALAYLYGESSRFYNRLYADGLINTDFFTETDYAADTLTLLAGGETRDPERLLREMVDEARRAADEGLNEALFHRIAKSRYGARLRGLNSFGALCGALVNADFGGYNALDAFRAAAEITPRVLRDFIADFFREEDFAMSVITPGETKGQ